jgi:hypothetical protein
MFSIANTERPGTDVQVELQIQGHLQIVCRKSAQWMTCNIME